MKYVKPSLPPRGYFTEEIADFLDSLPASFTVLEEVWPKGWTKEYLLRCSRGEYGEGVSLRAWLEALADIAPGPRKRKYSVWQFNNATPQLFSMDYRPGTEEWRKVGECEIEEG